METTQKAHKAGFVNILGSPNVGKSTLMNALVGENLSIITSKVQTTRHRIMGIVNGDDFQMVYSDTPGYIDNPNYKLHESMMSFVNSAIEDADVFLYVTEIKGDHFHQSLIDKMKNSKIPILVAINKIDEGDQKMLEDRVDYWKKMIPDAIILPISALHKFNIEMLFEQLLNLIPESPAYFPKDELTDKSLRFFVSEIIREKILLLFSKEIPYSVEVTIESFKEGEERTDIGATVHVMRESQKAIILGKQGQAIKQLGTLARKDIEAFLEKHIYLDLSVKVSKDWRENEHSLRKFGY